MRPFNVARPAAPRTPTAMFPRLPDLFRAGVQPNLNAVFAQSLGDFFGDVGSSRPSNCAPDCTIGDLRTQPPEQLPKLQAHNPPPSTTSCPGTPSNLHDRGAVEKRHIFSPSIEGRGRPATRVHKYLIGGQRPFAADFQFHQYRFRRGKASLAENQIRFSVFSSRDWLPPRKLSTMFRFRSRTLAISTEISPVCTP